ncbi:uncharacterized protein [Palaemon carinicauda]|uniref:uncharacterized protein n=1 Tax=Palaemon carinicauda TaxID=392227 RepID=UPI0035B5808B
MRFCLLLKQLGQDEEVSKADVHNYVLPLCRDTATTTKPELQPSPPPPVTKESSDPVTTSPANPPPEAMIEEAGEILTTLCYATFGSWANKVRGRKAPSTANNRSSVFVFVQPGIKPGALGKVLQYLLHTRLFAPCHIARTFNKMPVTTRAIGTVFHLLVAHIFSTEANYVVTDKWGQEYCRPSYCGLMDRDGWMICCERYKKCCAYVDLTDGKIADPFTFEKPKPVHLTPQTTLAPTTTPTTVKPEDITQDLGEPIELLPPAIGAGAAIQDQSGRPANLRLSSLDLIKPVTLEDEIPYKPNKPSKPSKNDVTYLLPPLHPDVQEMRLEEHRREACRSKFCALMEINQLESCCVRYKNCCAYVDYYAYQENPFFFEA